MRLREWALARVAAVRSQESPPWTQAWINNGSEMKKYTCATRDQRRQANIAPLGRELARGPVIAITKPDRTKKISTPAAPTDEAFRQAAPGMMPVIS